MEAQENNITVLSNIDLSYTINVYTDPEKGEKIPHFHVYFDDCEEIPDTLISLTDNVYIGEKSLENSLTERDLSRIDKNMRKPYEGGTLSVWEFLCNEWNECTPNGNIEFPKEQPDYTSIKDIIKEDNYEHTH